MKARIPLNLNANQRKAMNDEINRQILENDKEFSVDLYSIILYTLSKFFGFGKKRLKRFWKLLLTEHIALRKHYQMNPEDDGWLCRKFLKEKGVDVEKWYQEADSE